jgi:hypothetical protein
LVYFYRSVRSPMDWIFCNETFFLYTRFKGDLPYSYDARKPKGTALSGRAGLNARPVPLVSRTRGVATAIGKPPDQP